MAPFSPGWGTLAPVGPAVRPTSMVPPPSALPDVLPTDRLTATGMPRPFLRDELRRIPNGRNALNVASVWLQTAGLLALVCWLTPRSAARRSRCRCGWRRSC